MPEQMEDECRDGAICNNQEYRRIYTGIKGMRKVKSRGLSPRDRKIEKPGMGRSGEGS